MGTTFPDMSVAKDVDTERAVEALLRIKGKKEINEMKGRRDQRWQVETLALCLCIYIWEHPC